MNLPPGVAPDTPGARAPRIARMRERLRGAANDDPHGDAPAYAELHCLSDFSFLRGAASAEELFERATRCGYEALARSEEHTSELQSLMRISYSVFCLKKK